MDFLSVSDFALKGIYPFFRISSFFAFFIFTAHPAIPKRLMISLSVFLSALVIQYQDFPEEFFFDRALYEVVVGLSFGLLTNIVFYACEIAADFIAMESGLGFASFYVQSAHQVGSVLNPLFFWVALIVFLGADLHLVVIQGVLQSFSVFSWDNFDKDQINIGWVIEQNLQMWKIALQISWPIVLGLLLVNMGFMVLARVLPQMNVLSVGFSGLLFCLIALLWFSFDSTTAVLMSAFGSLGWWVR